MVYSKFELDTFEVDACYLCAIHSSLPSYKMAFLLNKQLGLKFQRAISDVIKVSKNAEEEVYPLYLFDDHVNYTTFWLVKNKCVVQEDKKAVAVDLFSAQTSQQSIKNLIPEYKKVDYFLKIETDNSNYPLKLLVSNILNIGQVVTAFSVDYNKIKNRTNLIFE